MTKEAYATYLTTRHWKSYVKRFCALPGNQYCFICGVTSPLDVHHKTYERIKHERQTDCVRLCHPHHFAVHDYLKERYWCICIPHVDAAIETLKHLSIATLQHQEFPASGVIFDRTWLSV